jgi:hypothetical protein
MAQWNINLCHVCHVLAEISKRILFPFLPYHTIFQAHEHAQEHGLPMTAANHLRPTPVAGPVARIRVNNRATAPPSVAPSGSRATSGVAGAASQSQPIPHFRQVNQASNTSNAVLDQGQGHLEHYL